LLSDLSLRYLNAGTVKSYLGSAGPAKGEGTAVTALHFTAFSYFVIKLALPCVPALAETRAMDHTHSRKAVKTG